MPIRVYSNLSQIELHPLMNIDFHCHSTFSDGSLPPHALARSMADAGIQLFALTDHDTTAGVPFAQEAAIACGIRCLSGVEVSCRWSSQDIHMVGVNIDVANPELREGLATQYQRRWDRAQKMCRRLEKTGLPDLFSLALDIAAQTGAESHSARDDCGPCPGRPHLAKALVKVGAVKDENQAFQKYLAIGKPAYVATDWPTLQESAHWIVGAGGIPILAHPLHYKLTRTKLERLVKDFAEGGGRAIEVVAPNQDPLQRKMLAGLCEKYGLCGSIASDFHGLNVPWIKLGKLDPLPRNVASIMTLLPSFQ